MSGIAVLVVVLCIIAGLAAVGVMVTTLYGWGPDEDDYICEVEREYYDADWDRIMEETKLDKKGGKKK